MRAADCIEKITVNKPAYLVKHKNEILRLSRTAANKELMWHLAQIIPRLRLATDGLRDGRKILRQWIADRSCSRIVRANALDGLFQLSQGNEQAEKEFSRILSDLEKENVPSLRARIRKIRKIDQSRKILVTRT